MAKKNTKKTKKRLSSAEISQRNEQRNQKKEICDILKNIGFEKLSYIDGKEFNYEGRTSELDDIFIFENVICQWYFSLIITATISLQNLAGQEWLLSLEPSQLFCF